MSIIAGTIGTQAEELSGPLAAERPRKRNPRAPKGMWKRGRVWWTRVAAPNGERKQLSLETTDLKEAKSFRGMLDFLSDPRRQSPDHLQRVCDGKQSVRALYARHVRGELHLVRSEADDPDLSHHVAGWSEWLGKRTRRPVADRQRTDYVRQIRTLIPEGKTFRRSRLTKKSVEGWLTNLGAESSSTQARYYAALRSFVKYLRGQGVVEGNPLDAVEAPCSAPPRNGYMPFADVQRLLAAMPDGDGRAMVALAFGSGLERSALLNLTVGDVIDPARRTILAPGTKNAARHRYVTVDQWAWPYVEQQLRGKIGHAKVFEIDYWQLIDTFYDAQIAIGMVAPLREGITPRNAGKKGVSIRGMFHTLHDCRHTYAVIRMLGEDGERPRDLQFIAAHLGHKNLQMVSRIYACHRHRIQATAEARHHAQIESEAKGEATGPTLAISR